jgi:class 3 adenylate cyclase
MALSDELKQEVQEIFVRQWSKRNGTVVPEPEDVNLGNDAVELDAVVLYADLDESTALVDRFPPEFAAEMYKAFLRCAARIIDSEGGTITAYDGDRVMAAFIGDYKNTSATRAALKMNYARIYIINPAIKRQYPNANYELRHTTGVDASRLFVSRTGVRGANDLVWVGRAANHAAKLTALSADYPSWITDEVYKAMNDSIKFTEGRPMWEAMTWNTTGRQIYRSTWWWRF